ncbi:MAG TPA: hypothetical protein VEU08_05845 [Vicinamibacterales bacterium]|nr:hypothetical protein [Vicinamibacterales bacterium]
MKTRLAGVALVLAVLGSAACTHAHANTAPEAPALEMPPPPPHDVEPIETEPLSSTTTAEPDETTRRPTVRRPAPPSSPPAKPETKPAEPAKPETPPEPPKPDVKPEEPRPTPPLQTAPATTDGETERVIRGSIQRATGDLNRIDYRALNADGRSQYDQAKRLMRQAEDAVREKNLVFARSLADKAETIAAQLAKR